MFFKSKKAEPVKEDSRIQDLKIITQMNQDLATTLDLNETLQNALEVIIKRINAQAANIFLINEKKKKFECIDNLHQDSGVPSDKVIELHGNTTYAKCLSCEKRYEIDIIKDEFLKTNIAPTCNKCGGIVKTATISFGQSMPEKEMIEAQNVTLNCDLFIAIGSSLQVYPAAGFPVLAKKNGSKLIILNREGTELDGYADLVINYEIGEFMDKVFRISN